MRSPRWILSLSLAFALLGLTPALAQRGGGSVRYSGARASAAGSSASAARSSASAYRSSASSSSTPVRYQKPMNTPPPIGSRPSTLPVGHARALYGGRSYYYYDGAYYADTYEAGVEGTGLPGYPSGPTIDRTEGTASVAATTSGGRYVVVSPPLGVSVDELPYGATEVKKGLWEYNGVHYRPAYEDGQVRFVVSNP